MTTATPFDHAPQMPHRRGTSPAANNYQAAYDALMRHLLQRAAARIAKQQDAAGTPAARDGKGGTMHDSNQDQTVPRLRAASPAPSDHHAARKAAATEITPATSATRQEFATMTQTAGPRLTFEERRRMLEVLRLRADVLDERRARLSGLITEAILDTSASRHQCESPFSVAFAAEVSVEIEASTVSGVAAAVGERCFGASISLR
jgi:hypothetical protein